ncbi:MAG: TolC family protein [Sedimentisphaerales bacterium]
MKRQLLTLVMILLSVGFDHISMASSDSNEPNNLKTIEDYLNCASANNAELKAKFEEWTSALEQIPQAKALPDPMLNYGKYVRESDMQMGQMAGVMQTFPWLGKIEAQTDSASAMAKAARQRLEATKLKLYWQVKKEFYEFLYLKEAIDIAQQNLELIKHFEQVALTKYTTATGTHPDTIRAQIELAKFDEILTSLSEFKKPQVARLNAILNRSVGNSLDWPQKPVITKVTINYDQLINLLKEKNPEIAELKWMIESSKNEIKLAKKKFYPDIGVGVEWTQFDKSGGNTGRDSVALVFQMNIPLWRDSYKAAEMQAKANERKITWQKIDTENNLIAQVAAVLYDIEETQRKINLYGDIIPKAEELVNASETAYKAGTVDFLSLIDSQRMLLQYNLDYHRLLTDNQQKIAEMEMLAGVPLN